MRPQWRDLRTRGGQMAPGKGESVPCASWKPPFSESPVTHTLLGVILGSPGNLSVLKGALSPQMAEALAPSGVGSVLSLPALRWQQRKSLESTFFQQELFLMV